MARMEMYQSWEVFGNGGGVEFETQYDFGSTTTASNE